MLKIFLSGLLAAVIGATLAANDIKPNRPTYWIILLSAVALEAVALFL